MVTLDGTVLVYAVPVVAAVIAVLGLWSRVRMSPWQSRRATQSPVPGMIVGAVGLAIGAGMFYAADADHRAYERDPGCTAGFSADATSASACRIASMRIVRFYWTGGRYPERHLSLLAPDGSRHDVTYARDVRASVWRGIEERDDRFASVQYFKRDVVLVETGSGLATTSREPQARMNFGALIGVALGFLGVVSALRATFAPGAVPAF